MTKKFAISVAFRKIVRNGMNYLKMHKIAIKYEINLDKESVSVVFFEWNPIGFRFIERSCDSSRL